MMYKAILLFIILFIMILLFFVFYNEEKTKAEIWNSCYEKGEKIIREIYGY